MNLSGTPSSFREMLFGPPPTATNTSNTALGRSEAFLGPPPSVTPGGLLGPPAGTFAPIAYAELPLNVSNPTLDGLADRQARFRIDGSGPLASRSIVPVTTGAKDLVASGDGAVEAVRRVLKLIESTGPASGVVNGVSFADSQEGLGANTYRAHIDSDRTFRKNTAGLGARQLQEAARRLGDRSVQETQGMLANVVSGWMNLGPVASSALLGRPGGAGPQQLGEAVRIVLHEAQHAAAEEDTGLSRDADLVFQEALAERATSRLPQLKAARRTLGLDGLVPDAALSAALATRPYAEAELRLDNAMRVAGIEAGSVEEIRLIRASPKQAVDILARGMASAGKQPEQTARKALEVAFGELAPKS